MRKWQGKDDTLAHLSDQLLIVGEKEDTAEAVKKKKKINWLIFKKIYYLLVTVEIRHDCDDILPKP